MRQLIIAAAIFAAACSPPAHDQSKGETPTAGSETQVAEPTPEQRAMTDALAQRAAGDIGVPVKFTITSAQTEGDWAFIVAQPWSPEGASLDWSQTRYAQRAQDGVLDGNGTTYALLRKQNNVWTVVDFVVGPTDVAYADWPQRYGAPAAIFGVSSDK